MTKSTIRKLGIPAQSYNHHNLALRGLRRKCLAPGQLLCDNLASKFKLKHFNLNIKKLGLARWLIEHKGACLDANTLSSISRQVK